MRHFDIEDWTDFARGLSRGQQRREMGEHLESGCSACRHVLDLLLLVVADARSESEPPPYAVRGVRALFGLASRSWASRARRLLCAPVYDSYLQPALVGTRNLQGLSRHLVFNSRDFVIDTRMEYASGGREMSVVGQIVTRTGAPVPQVPAFLITGREVLSSDLTTGLGEFFMTCHPKGNLRLCLSVEDDDVIEVDLDRRHPGGDGSRERWLAEWDFRRSAATSGGAEARGRTGGAEPEDEN